MERRIFKEVMVLTVGLILIGCTHAIVIEKPEKGVTLTKAENPVVRLHPNATFVKATLDETTDLPVASWDNNGLQYMLDPPPVYTNWPPGSGKLPGEHQLKVKADLSGAPFGAVLTDTSSFIVPFVHYGHHSIDFVIVGGSSGSGSGSGPTSSTVIPATGIGVEGPMALSLSGVQHPRVATVSVVILPQTPPVTVNLTASNTNIALSTGVVSIPSATGVATFTVEAKSLGKATVNFRAPGFNENYMGVTVYP